MAESLPPASHDGDRRSSRGRRRAHADPDREARKGRSGPAAGVKNSDGRPAGRAPSRKNGKHPPERRSGDDGATAPRRPDGHPDKPAPPSTASRQAYAAIDLGTNNCRLLIARAQGENFMVIDAFSRVVRLGEGLAQSGRLSDEAMERALGALKVCSQKLRRRNVHLARSVATEACRRASNGQDFIDRVREETGIVLDVISAQEEARLAVLGCHVLLERGEGPAMIFDIGGGSTELVLIETGDVVPRILDWQSVPWGVVSLTESFPAQEGEDDAQRLARYRDMRRKVADSFRQFSRRLEPFRTIPRQEDENGPRLLGTSGTVTTLASVHLGLEQYDRQAVDGLIVPAQAMRGIASDLSTMDFGQRAELPCIGHDRAELVVAGCAILETILDLWPATRLGVADRGIREGILRSLMGGTHAHSGSLARPLSPREQPL
ncbi:Ppx/GppA phosphatase family protein [Croceicoccus marinus]|uniref:Exopolyphosphatase n=1 Tax=Croceicoccus marinus TaxID=450378 RepID=A0A1Z1F7U5_9SPHN|nr:Ppx/GppA phosphatase family protein [Croceicoccus marinus]ARU14879.1 exopolyphosphatase [Croceicoccus marinus]